MWGLVVLFYMVGFFQRVAPAVMAQELMSDFRLGGALLGNLSATYFYAYAAMQVPSGLLADQIGPRRLATYACVVATIGIFVFSFGPNLWFAYIGRFLVGASVAVAWITCMKLAGHWFPANRFATVTGVALLFGNIGAILAGIPLAFAVSSFGWRLSMAVSGVLTLVLAVATWLAVRDDPKAYGYKSYAHAKVLENGSLKPAAALKSVMARKDTWLLAFAGGFSAAPVLVFAGLWGVPYLTQVYGLQRSEAAALTSTMLISWAVSGPVLGMLSDRIGRRKSPYLIATCFAALFWACFLFADIPHLLLYPLLALIGFSSGALIIGFAFARELNDPGAAGAVGGVVNMSVLGIAAIMQPLLGKILDLHWQGNMVEGARVYGAEAYSDAFFWLFASTLLAVVMVLFTRETYCRVQGE